MKNLVVFCLVTVLGLLVAPAALAQAPICNMQCQVDQDCGTGYGCYVGVCRARNCVSDNRCSCYNAANVTPTPKATPRTTATPSATPLVIVKSTPVATISARLHKTPTTGFSLVDFAKLSVVIALAGASFKYVASSNILKPLTFEDVSKGREIKK